MTESSSFDLVAFVPVLRERMYTTNSFAKQFVLSWVSMRTIIVSKYEILWSK